MTKRMRTLPYYGGKQALAGWINSHLPRDPHTYVEPFLGAGAVLLDRPAAKAEIVNDKSNIVVSWWRCLRDDPDTLERLVELTPRSRDERRRAYDITLSAERHSQMQRAWAFHILAEQSMSQKMTERECWQWHSHHRTAYFPSVSFARIYDRIKNVQLDCRDAITFLKSYVEQPFENSRRLIYADPPYRTADTSSYLATLDYDAFEELLLACECDVAVSGYEADYPRLTAAGWRIARIVRRQSTTSGTATECLWMNYDPPQQGMFDHA